MNVQALLINLFHFTADNLSKGFDVESDEELVSMALVYNNVEENSRTSYCVQDYAMARFVMRVRRADSHVPKPALAVRQTSEPRRSASCT